MFLDPNPPSNPTQLLARSSATKPSRSGGAAPQELTLSYLCDPPKPSTDPSPSIPVPSKGKEIAPSSPSSSAAVPAAAGGACAGGGTQWVERDFLHLSADQKRSSPAVDHDAGAKKPRIEPLNLSLSLTPTDPSPDPPRRAHSGAAPNPPLSENYSYSMSVPFSHNPSCSLTMNSTENYESEHLWCGAGEGTNGSVHSRFRPAADGNSVALASLAAARDPSFGGGGGGARRATGSESHSFFPSELPARPLGNAATTAPARPERMLREIVSESATVMTQILQELPTESVAVVKDCLRSMMGAAERRDELAGLQRRLERRSDLTADTLSKCHRAQLDILVAIRTGVADFLSAKNRLSNAELVEVFLLSRCRNVDCKSVLPVDDCDCKICSTKKGFCSACMCPVCFKFDCASNTCSWVGCDVSSHWCHAVCGIQKSLIRPGPSLKGSLGTTEMQFHCLGCGHASEMFGFVKEVFTCCAKDWGLETLMKELDCVRKIFQGSQDFEGKALQGKAEEMLTMLGKKLVSPADACNAMLQFFKYGVADHSVTGGSSKGILMVQASQRGDALAHPSPVTTILPPKPTFNLKPTSSFLDTQIDASKSNPKLITPEPHFGLPKKEEGGLQSLESIMKFKEAEAKLFQRLADDAKREVESYRQIARAKTEKLEEEYTSKLARLCLHETEERRRRKLEELKFLENSHYDYHNMKMRMQAEIAGLLERMEATKKQWL